MPEGDDAVVGIGLVAALVEKGRAHAGIDNELFVVDACAVELHADDVAGSVEPEGHLHLRVFVLAMAVEEEGEEVHAVEFRFGLFGHDLPEIRQGVEYGGLSAGVAAVDDAYFQQFGTFDHLVDVMVAHLCVVGWHETERLPFAYAEKVLN